MNRVVRKVIDGGARVNWKGVRHPDDLIDPKMSHLYLASNKKITPLGRFTKDTNELYFGKRRRR